MKKIVAVLLISLCFVFSACTTDTSGYMNELTSSKWEAKLEGGAELSLEFDEDTAVLKINNSGKSTEIKGDYIADQSSFVIFMPEVSQNYSFDYTPKGNKLDLTHNNNTITLNKVE
ncbi:hypothetical protein [Ruminococcus sp.]|uniref:hypothetical protein n=1 Tax=Ruminococcus sp. TaxID=41978 RepID=UPI000EDE9943|nr:hypothetical protein [Ruminococcus sp.]MCI6616804.1 hypothetical protein [Ruminococcus sp.]HCI59221.1 hypothetical protein [Ruminococcus sp.]